MSMSSSAQLQILVIPPAAGKERKERCSQVGAVVEFPQQQVDVHKTDGYDKRNAERTDAGTQADGNRRENVECVGGLFESEAEANGCNDTRQAERER